MAAERFEVYLRCGTEFITTKNHEDLGKAMCPKHKKMEDVMICSTPPRAERKKS